MRTPTALVALPVVLFLSGCRQDRTPGPVASASTSVSAPAPALPPRAKLARQDLNRLAVRLDMPLFWVADANGDGAVDPAEVVTLRFYPTSPQWTRGGAFTPAFDDAYRRLVAAAREPAPDARREKLRGELDEAAGALVRTDLRGASDEERAFVAAMLAVADRIDDLYATQSGRAAIAPKVPADEPDSRSVLRRNGGPECVTPRFERDPACSATPGSERRRVDVYPASAQEDPKFCDVLEKRADAKALLDPFVVVREVGGKLAPVPYTVAYAAQMEAVAAALRAAEATLVDPKEEPLRGYLRAAAASFRSNDWRPADEAWSKMTSESSRWYVRVAPDEVYWEPCSHKAGFHLSFARINQGSLAWQRRLSPLQQRMEDELAELIGEGYRARKVTFHLPDFIDIVVNAGDSRDAIGATVGQSLPNWGPVADQGRGRTVAMSNLYTDADSLLVRRKKAESLFTKESLASYSDEPDAGLLSTILHEATHNLGPTHSHKARGLTDSAAFGGDLASMLEELKAQTGGLFLVGFGVRHGVIDATLARRTYMDSLVWAVNHVSRGMWADGKRRKHYGQLAAIQLGFLLREGALAWSADAVAANGVDRGAFSVDFDRLPAAIERMTKLVGGVKARGDKAEALRLCDEYVDGPVVPHAVIAERCGRFPQPSFVYAVDL